MQRQAESGIQPCIPRALEAAFTKGSYPGYVFEEEAAVVRYVAIRVVNENEYLGH